MISDRYYRNLLFMASILGAAGVALGAFGAHALRSRLDPGELDVFKTAVLYLFIHVLATVLVYAISRQSRVSRWLSWAGAAFVTGVILFSGSLFLIGTRGITGWNTSFIGPVTPLGGLCFIAGWLCLARHALKAGK